MTDTIQPVALDDKGRCCGKKPAEFKRPNHHLYCGRCYRSYDPDDKEQVENWAWKRTTRGWECQVGRLSNERGKA